MPVLGGTYALLVPAAGRLGSIELVERRVLLAAGVALLLALLLGYGGARMFARRIRRLERAADRIANGRFDEPVVDTGGGELGALAAAFERMRVRLAHLDDARRSSLPTPRTSCARRSSRWPASSSCSTTRSWTSRRGSSSSARCGSRSTA